jgi:hypothetical protein
MTDTPAATRARTPGWRDPRLWIGVALVAASVLSGAVVLAGADDTVPVWAAADTMVAGHVLTADDLTVQRVRFAGDGAGDLYFAADRPLPAHLRLVHGMAAGELLPRAAVGSTEDADLRQVPVSVAPDQVPRQVGTGSVVDVYLRPATRDGCQASPVCSGRPVVAGVTVLDAPAPDESFGPDAGRMLVLGLTSGEARRFFQLLASTDQPTVTVVGRG